MKISSIKLIGIACASTILGIAAPSIALDPQLPVYRAAGKLTGEVRIVGGGKETMEVLTKRWIEDFQKQQPGLRCSFEGMSHAEAMEAIATGKADVAVETQAPVPSELQHFKSRTGYDPLEVTVGLCTFNNKGRATPLGVYVHKDNPISQLTLDQLDAKSCRCQPAGPRPRVQSSTKKYDADGAHLQTTKRGAVATTGHACPMHADWAWSRPAADATGLMRRAIFNFHLWSGLVLGAFLFVSASTGIVLAFRRPLDVALNREMLSVSPGGARVSLDTIAANALRVHDGHTPQWIEVPSDPSRPVQVRFIDKDEVYVDPYTGQPLGSRNQDDGLLYQIEKLHRYLLAGSVGEVVMAVSAGLSVFVLISGIYLWFPKSSSRWKEAFKLNSRLKARAWDVNLHKVIGIYTASIILVLAASGVALALEPVIKPQHNQPVSTKPAKKKAQRESEDLTGVRFNEIWRKVEPLVGDYRWVRFGFPQKKDGLARVTFVRAADHANALSYLYLDLHSLEVVRTELYQKQPRGYRFYLWLNPLHTGETGGWIWRVVTLMGAVGLIALIGTGGWLYYRRKVIPLRRPAGGAVAAETVNADLARVNCD